MPRFLAPVSFLTVIPAGAHSIGDAARYVHLFPLVGLLVGAVASSAGFALSGFDPLIAAVVMSASVMFVTGLHHLDGLADFADALMARTTRERRLQIMKDASTGTAGTAAISISLVLLLVLSYRMVQADAFVAIILAEMAAKSCMVFSALIPAASPGSASCFARSMGEGRVRALAVAVFAASAALAFAAAGAAAGAILLGAAIPALLVLLLAKRTLGGITGDVLGAVNETSRLGAYLLYLAWQI